MINASRRRFVAGLVAAPAIIGAPGLARAQGGKPLTILLTVPPVRRPTRSPACWGRNCVRNSTVR